MVYIPSPVTVAKEYFLSCGCREIVKEYGSDTTAMLDADNAEVQLLRVKGVGRMTAAKIKLNWDACKRAGTQPDEGQGSGHMIAAESKSLMHAAAWAANDVGFRAEG